MPFSMSQTALPTFEITLNALSAVLEKAEVFAKAKKIDDAVILRSRLAPDMFDLARQVQVATDGAKRGSARLAGRPRAFGDGDHAGSDYAGLPARHARCGDLAPASRPRGRHLADGGDAP